MEESLIRIYLGMCAFTVMVNVCLLGLTLKLYTEYFKDKSATNRKRNGEFIEDENKGSSNKDRAK